jgi:hypothetical protein
MIPSASRQRPLCRAGTRVSITNTLVPRHFFLMLTPPHRCVYTGRVAARLVDVISYRLTDSRRLQMEKLKATFPDNGWRDVHEWIISLPGVAEAINERIEHQ